MSIPLIVDCINGYAKVTNINLSPAHSWLMDVNDLPLLGKYLWHINENGYVCRNNRGKIVKLHRLIINAPDHIPVDHRDGNKLDMRMRNLRLCTNMQNLQNRGAYRNNTSGYKGVFWDTQKKRWRAAIGYNGKIIRLGLYKDKTLAALDYNRAALKYHGEFAKLNEICG